MQVQCLLISDGGRDLCDLGYAISGFSLLAVLVLGVLSVSGESGEALLSERRGRAGGPVGEWGAEKP